MDNYYEILEISKISEEEEIKNAHRQKVRLWRNRTNNPDLSRRQEAEQVLKRLEQAKSILLDPGKRADYNRQLEAYVEIPNESDIETTIAPIENSAQELIQKGWQLLAEGKLSQAIKIATYATQIDGSNPQAWALLAQVKFRQRSYEDAIYEFKRAISFAPNQDRFFFDLGCVYQAANRLEEALLQFQHASKINESSVMYKASVGEIYLEQKNYSQGIDILEKCVDLEPENQSYKRLLVDGYSEVSYRNWTFWKGDYYATEKRHIVEAQEYLRRAETLLPNELESAGAIRAMRQNVQSNMKRKFVGNAGTMIIASFVWSLIYGFGILLAPLYYLSCRVPQYSINKRALSGDKDFGGSVASSGGCLGIIVVIMIFPVMIGINFFRNYTGENAVPQLKPS